MSVTAMAPKLGEKEQEQNAKKSKKKLFVIVSVLVVLLGAGGAGYWFFLKPSGPPAPPKPGTVMKLDPIQLNLQNGHYLRIGIALQLTSTTSEVDGSKALDATIALFSGQSMDALADSVQREKLKEQLTRQLSAQYDGQVMGVYFTDFVTQ